MADLSLAIVTSVRGYGRYLPDWAKSIVALRRRPTMVGLVHNGHPGDAAAVEAAAATLRTAGLRVVTQAHQSSNLGVLRNAAVALSDTEWVMHLDADDMVMPHALDDVAALAPSADVVSLGYERCGDLAAGPRNRVKTYRTHRGRGTLQDPTPSSGVSPFRRTLWERRPYPTDQVGGWDTALWLNFAHLGARFVPTHRPCFWYRQHADSIFNVRRKGVGVTWPAVLTGLQLESRRRGDHGVSIVVPRAGTNDPARDRAWAWLARRYRELYPSWQVLEGVSRDGLWSKGAAVADGLSRATGRILIMADSDCLVPKDALLEAVRLVESGEAPWVVPHTTVHRLTQRASEAVIAEPATRDFGAPQRRNLDRDPYLGFAGGGVFVVARTVYVATGGIPAAFRGWGAEDECMALILDTMVGPFRRLDHPLLHLWHPVQETKLSRGFYRQNRLALRRYQAVARRPEEMWELLRSSAPAFHPVDHFTPDRRYRTLATAATAADDAAPQEASVHDYFARRRLARAQAAKQQLREGPPMAGALDITRAHAAARRRQAAVNAAAVAEADQAASRAAELTRLQPHERRAAVNRDRLAAKMQPAPENKMIATAPPTKSIPSGVVTKGPEPSKAQAPTLPPGSVVGKSGVPFASAAARQLAQKLGLVTLGDFTGHDGGPRGFTVAAVRAIAAAKKAQAAK